jgi:hypothetical protein
VVTATFQRLCVSVLVDISTRRIVHWSNRPPHGGMDDPAVPELCLWMAASASSSHDRDGIFAPAVDEALQSMLQSAPIHAATKVIVACGHMVVVRYEP